MLNNIVVSAKSLLVPNGVYVDDSEWTAPDPDDPLTPTRPGTYEYRLYADDVVKYFQDQRDIEMAEDIIITLLSPHFKLFKWLSGFLSIPLRIIEYKDKKWWYDALRKLIRKEAKYILIKYEYDLYFGYRRSEILVEY